MRYFALEKVSDVSKSGFEEVSARKIGFLLNSCGEGSEVDI